MSKQLPERPDLGQLKKQAKDLLDEVHAGGAGALARVGLRNEPGDGEAAAFALADAQRVLAREYGFASWPKLKLHVETRAEAAAESRLIEAALEGERDAIDTILRERPGLVTRNVFAAAALGDRERIERELESNPGMATQKGGPRAWDLLLYVCFGKCGGDDAARAAAVHALLARGANPNASWFHPDWPEAPLPALYGATGVNNYPLVARALLEAGANPNDSESRYHAAEHNHVASLEVLRAFRADFSGVDHQWVNTPLCFLLGAVAPTDDVRRGLRWLLEHGADPNVRTYRATLDQTALHTAVANDWDVETVALLLKHGADPTLPRRDGRTAYELAMRFGRDDLVAVLRTHGAPIGVHPRDEFLGHCMRGDHASARRVLDVHPEVLTTLLPGDWKLPLLIARRGRAEALTVLGRFGFNLAIEGDDGEHPLHWAAWHGHAAAARALIATGVPVDARDRRFKAPPLGWCSHGSLHCRNPAGDYPAVAEALLAGGAAAELPPRGLEFATQEVMAVVRRYAEQNGK